MRSLTFLTLSTTDWDAPQFGSRQAIASSLARRGHRVLFVEVPRALHSIISDPAGTARALRRLGRHRTIEGRLVAYTPRPLFPVYYHPWSNALNQRLLRRDLQRVLESLGWQPDVLWTYWPNSAALCGRFGEQLAVYHCIDDFSAVSYPLVRSETIAAMETELCRRVDMVLASTEDLAAARRLANPRTFHLPTGVDLESFDPEGVEMDAEVRSLPPPRIGFVGTLDDRIDTEMMVDCARRLPQAIFVFVGAVKRHRASTAPLAALANVRLLPPRAHDEIPAVLAAFDAAIIPYRRTRFTKNLAPAKLYEYLAMGVPTVSSDLPFAQRAADHLSIVRDGEQLAAALRRIIETPPVESDRRRWRAAAAANSWEARVDEIEALLSAEQNRSPEARPTTASQLPASHVNPPPLHAAAERRDDPRLSVLQVVASSQGGGATHVRDLVSELDAARFAVEVAMPDDGGHIGPQDFARLGIPSHSLPLAAGVSGRALHDLRRIISRFQVVHAHGARAAFWVRLAALTLPGPRPRVVYSIHGLTAPYEPPWRRAALRLVEAALAPVTDRYVAVCQAERDAAVATHLCSSGRVAVVRNGVEVRRFTPHDRVTCREQLPVPAAATLVTTVCRLNRPRDFETLLTAFREIADADASAHLLVAGDGPWETAIRQRRDDLGLQTRVTFAGQRDDIEVVLAASDIFVLTSTGGDGLPISILEAMAAGLPVVATAAAGIPEAVIADQTGLLVQRGDSRSLAAALLRLIRDRETRIRFGEAGRRRALRELDVRDMVAALAGVYQDVVAATERRP